MLAQLKPRLLHFRASLPPPVQEVCDTYFAATFPAMRDDAGGDDDPRLLYWELFPRWLDDALRQPGAPCAAALGDLLWAQYCLFFAVRMQDDIFDMQAGHRALVHVADLFRDEALLCLARLEEGIPGVLVHAIEALRTTTTAIVTTTALQVDPASDTDDLLEGHAQTASIFTVAPWAVCRLHARTELDDACERFIGAMTIAGQIMDDLEDVEEDAALGRITVAARLLLPSGRRPDDAVLVASPHAGEALRRPLQTAAAHLHLAAVALDAIPSEPARAMIRRQTAGILRLLISARAIRGG